MDDLAIIVVSHNSGAWLRRCLRSVLAHSEGLALDLVVVDNGTDGAGEHVRREFPHARVLHCENRGFAHANNRALMTCDARYILFLNPDTEILEGTFAELVCALDARPSVGLAGVKQVTADGALFPTVRRFPNALRALAEALGSERAPLRAVRLGERELDLSVYGRELSCDWTSGSFMLARREAIYGAGFLDERFFIYGEEPDLCLRMKDAGWEVRHLPLMTILHHADKEGISPKMEAQNAFARLQYARKHFSALHRGAYVAALCIRYGLRAIAPAGGDQGRQRRAASRRALRVLRGSEEPPFGRPPATSIVAGGDEPTA
jgi:GT2 family glycosyltransferase